MSNYQVIAELVDSFDLAGGSANGRHYEPGDVKAAIMATGDQLISAALFGYYSHSTRDKPYGARMELTPPKATLEQQLRGELFTGRYAPASICIAIRVDGTIVTHRNLVLNTEPGLMLLNDLEHDRGGWSWAMSADGKIPTAFHGIDWTPYPSFKSLCQWPGGEMVEPGLTEIVRVDNIIPSPVMTVRRL